MVDLLLLQSVSYIAGALGVCVAAFYYVMTLRTQQENMRLNRETRKIELTNTMLHNLLSKESWQRFAETMNMKWTDFDDFVKKYDSTVNPELFALRMSYFSSLDYIGYLYKQGILDVDTVYRVGGSHAIWVYSKFKPIIDEYRRISWGMDRFENLDYLAKEMYQIQKRKDPTFKGDAFYFTEDQMQQVFKNE